MVKNNIHGKRKQTAEAFSYDGKFSIEKTQNCE